MNASNDPNTEYLSDGITESIINSLSQLPNLKVMARTTVFRYKGQSSDPQKVGRDLGVEAVLTGKVLHRGDTLIAQVDLVNVSDGSELWGQQYKLSDALAVQEEIAMEISANLRLKLSGEQQSRVTKHYTENPEAYQLYLKGRFYWNKRTGEALKKAIEYFNQAIEKDPTYALAYAGLADAYVLSSFLSTDSPQEAFAKAKAAAKKALELDETLAEAHTSLASALSLYDWNFPESNREFQRAIELNPNYATAHHWYGGTNLAALGRVDEAIAEMKRAQELDPLSLIINADLGEAYFEARQYDRSIEQLRKTVEMDQSFYYAHYHLGMAYEMKGSLSDAITEYYKARQLDDDPRVLAFLGHAFAASGKRDDALKTLEQLKEISRQRYVQAYSFAIIYAGLGEKDKAFQWLERSYQEHAPRMIRLKVDPFLDNLRSDPRFDDLLRRIGLSP
jgi:TolB-like protein/Tfp pilus assembly protein PilF